MVCFTISIRYLRSLSDNEAAYTIYSFFEWSLILFDVAFDAVTAIDFQTFELVVRDVKGLSRGYVQLLPRYTKVRRNRTIAWLTD